MKLFDVLYTLPAEFVVRETVQAETETEAKQQIWDKTAYLKDREDEEGVQVQIFREKGRFIVGEADKPEGYGERPAPRLVPDEFRMDVSDRLLPGYHDPNHRWNGWAVPAFTFNQALDVMNEVNRSNSEAVQQGQLDISQVSFIHYDPIKDMFMITDMQYALDEKDTYQPQGSEAFYSNGVKLYDIGGYNWCWTAKGDFGE
jgi:hypothetical protein